MKGRRKGGEEDWRRGKKIKGKEREVAFCRGEGAPEIWGYGIFVDHMAWQGDMEGARFALN